MNPDQSTADGDEKDQNDLCDRSPSPTPTQRIKNIKKTSRDKKSHNNVSHYTLHPKPKMEIGRYPNMGFCNSPDVTRTKVDRENGCIIVDMEKLNTLAYI
ncbi:uncharacterized protein EAE97_002294 [Botrytis byssoidea]|uniref:Uncharacterized protein n=1 Tax=Botrytis byssoidea TaxID=139641 RepID=A0A9P5IVT7_9HELO|nr:uncharacterized protein EAE97_002294 [Botrytis byssoidea]KAF7950742.1 hypothetical protein EAE97_002294 [Botrytis byssoidea]